MTARAGWFEGTRRYVIAGVVGVAVLAFVVPSVARWFSAGVSVNGTRLRIAEVHRGRLTRDVTVQAKVVAAVSPTLYAPAVGIVSLKIKAGDVVERDQVLAEIDSPELKNKLLQEQATLQSLETEVERARIDARKRVGAAQKAVDQAEVDKIAAEREHQRNAEVFHRGAVSELTVLRAKDAVDKAVLTLNQAKADVSLERDASDFEIKTKALARDRQRLIAAEIGRQVEALKVRAPVSGQVGTLLVADRANVAANAGLLSVVDLSAMELEVQVPESYARDLAIGMNADIEQGAQHYAGKVASVSAEVVSGQVSGRVRFAGPQPEGLRQSQRMNLRIVFDERDDVLIVDRGSFIDEGGGRAAYVLANGVAERRPIVLGAAGLAAVEVIDGLKVGDKVVISGADAFRDAPRVIVND